MTAASKAAAAARALRLWTQKSATEKAMRSAIFTRPSRVRTERGIREGDVRSDTMGAV